MDAKLCPSAPLYENSKLIGIVNSEGSVDLLSEPLEINEAFIDSANKCGIPEERFRFVNKCVKSGCKQWQNNQCTVINFFLKKETAQKIELKDCSIRTSCRWFEQEGEVACSACPKINFLNYL